MIWLSVNRDCFIARISLLWKFYFSSLRFHGGITEGGWIAGVINDLLPLRRQKFGTDVIRKFLDSYNRNIFSPYVCCFSEERDLLSQWRGYASDGYGFAIGLNSDLLPCTKGVPRIGNFGDEKSGKLYLSKVEYDLEKQKAHVGRLLDFSLNNILKNQEIDISMIRDQLEYLTMINLEMGSLEPLGGGLHDVMGHLVGYATIAKNPAFHEEREFRLVNSPMIFADIDTNKTTHIRHEFSEPKYRVSNNRICAYYELDISEYWKDGVIAEIIKGPKNETSYSDLRAMFGRTDCPNIPVVRSQASYR